MRFCRLRLKLRVKLNGQKPRMARDFDDLDKRAITEYQRVVAEYPRSRWAAEAQYLAGWLEFNLGNYRAGIPALERTLNRYSKTRWKWSARWFLGLSYFLLAEYDKALVEEEGTSIF